MPGMEKMDLLFTRHRQCFIFRLNQLSKEENGDSGVLIRLTL
jgi:hypothetical protein